MRNIPGGARHAEKQAERYFRATRAKVIKTLDAVNRAIEYFEQKQASESYDVGDAKADCVPALHGEGLSRRCG